MDFRSLEVFVWVATLGSFRGAAARLNTTQPAVSQRIAQLEGEFGCRLLERSRGAVAPTERGRALLPQAERILRLAAEIRASIGSPCAVRGEIRLGVSETIVHTWLPRFVERVAASYPNLALAIDVDITPTLADRLASHALDLAFLLGPVEGAGMRNRPLCRFPLAFLASPRLRLPDGTVPLDVLARQSFVTFARRTLPHLALGELFAGLDPPPRIHASASLATVLRMALDGIGVALVPSVIGAAEVAAGRLVPVGTALPLPDLAFTASWHAAPDGVLPEALAAIAIEVAAG